MISTSRMLMLAALLAASTLYAGSIEIEGVSLELVIRPAGECGIRITLKPLSQPHDFPGHPALIEQPATEPALRLRQIDSPVRTNVGKMTVIVDGEPLNVVVRGTDGEMIQQLVFEQDGVIRFLLDDQPVLGLGEGGPRAPGQSDWRKLPVEFDRRGRLHRMEPRWQANAYGSRNPVPLLIGTGGWSLYFSTPWGQIDLTDTRHGRFIPISMDESMQPRQNQGNQTKQLSKGLPPYAYHARGFRDVFVFDAGHPRTFMKDVSDLSGRAVLPPRWALGYMQSHRTLEDDEQMIRIAETFREKKIPLDALIYLGTGFTPRGWNKHQPSFEFNPEIFRNAPAEVIGRIHRLHAKVVLHMVPWDRDRLPVMDDTHMMDYWKEHTDLVKAGVDGWWPDEGDWFDLFERLKRHQLYYDGPLSSRPDRRPWSLHRNGYLGIARWGGWVWSGDTDSSWKSLEAQVAVGINHSLSLSPYWGSDIGGFYPSHELSGALYARWFQFGAFCPSFRSHGRTWWTRLPWGWGLDTLGPNEHPESPDASTLNDPSIEEIARRYAELRYRLLPYNYTLAWQARETGMPFMRALWLHYPDDTTARGIGDEYLWGRDILVAPVYTKGAEVRNVYLPDELWYDWWTGKRIEGGRTVPRQVDLETLPLYVRAGAIIPLDPVRQYTSEPVNDPCELRIHPGGDGAFELYEDEGDNQNYLTGKHALIPMRWIDKEQTLVLDARKGSFPGMQHKRTFRIVIAGRPDEEPQEVQYTGASIRIPVD